MAAAEQGIKMLLYEAGEALRFDEVSIRAGLKGVLNVMRALDMLPAAKRRHAPLKAPVVARSSSWERAPESGILRTLVPLGNHVGKDQLLALIADPFGESEIEVRARQEGVVIGRSQMPLVHQGEALYHLARFRHAGRAAESLEAFHETIYPESGIDDEPEPPIQ
jgi:predicted deacylase